MPATRIVIKGYAMRMTIVFLLAAITLAGCDNNQNSEQPDENSSAGQQDSHTSGQTGELVRILHNLEKTDEQCQKDGCPRVELQWITFENQPALNKAITTQLAGMLVQNEGSSPHDGTIEGLADAFLADASDMAMASEQGWELTASIRRQNRRGDLLTLRMDSYEYTGGAHGLPNVQYFHWDLARQQKLTLADLLEPGQQATFWKLARSRHEQWLDQEKLDQAFRDSWPFDRTDNVYFDKDGLVLHYNVYHIAPYAMGQPTLTIPYEQLDGIVRGKYL